MSLKLKDTVTQEELILYEIMRHPVLCGEFIYNVDVTSYDAEIEFADYQKEFICDFNSYVSLTCGRAVGKTFSLVSILLWALLNRIFPDDYLLYTVPNKVHLEPVWAGLVRMFRTNSVLEEFILPNKGLNSGEHSINLLNGAQLICRIAGTKGDGTNVIGLHSPFEILDEGGYYPWSTYLELIPTGNFWNQGFRRIISGVPTGFRENNVLYHADMENSSYTKHRINAQRNPRYTEEDEERNLEQYGGKDSDDYIHFVLGRHGKPVFAVFDRNLMQLESYPVYKLVMDGIKLKQNLAEYFKLLSVLPSCDKQRIYMGIDLGYTDPTAILILYQTRTGQFKFHAKVQLNKVPYPIQSKIIDYLDSKFSPIFIGIDEGSVGKAEIQKLQMAEEYSGKDYATRIIPVAFNSSLNIGFDSDGQEIKSKVRPLAVTVLQDYSNNHRIIYSSADLELVSELERMVYTKTPAGVHVYRTLTPKGGQRGNDHFTAALLCFSIAWYLNNEMLNLRPQKVKLMTPVWTVN